MKSKFVPCMLIIFFVISCFGHTIYVQAEETYIPKSLDIYIGNVPYNTLTIWYKKQGATYSFSSNNTKVVKVSKKIGALTGVKEGTATITCKETINGKTKVIGTCNVTVHKAKIKQTEKTLEVGKKWV